MPTTWKALLGTQQLVLMKTTLPWSGRSHVRRGWHILQGKKEDKDRKENKLLCIGYARQGFLVSWSLSKDLKEVMEWAQHRCLGNCIPGRTEATVWGPTDEKREERARKEWLGADPMRGGPSSQGTVKTMPRSWDVKWDGQPLGSFWKVGPFQTPEKP